MTSPTSNALGKRPVDVDDADMDDLDDVLNDFTPNRPAKSAPQTTATTNQTTATPAPPAASTGSQGTEEIDFMEELAREMKDMLIGLETHQGPSSSTDTANAGGANAMEDATHDKLLLALEDLVAKGMVDVPPEVAGDGKSDVTDESKDAFRKSRDEAAERLRKSDTELQAGPPASDDLAAEDEALLQNLLEGMMNQLMSKEVLYEPLKELNDKFPSYLASNTNKLSASDLARYQEQHACSSKIIAVFDGPGYRDDDPKMAAEIIALMNKMQEHGAPPAEIMGELPPGLDLSPDGVPKLPDECVIG